MMENINNKGGITLDGMMPNGLSASDVALLNNDGNFGGNGAYFWIFGFLLCYCLLAEAVLVGIAAMGIV